MINTFVYCWTDHKYEKLYIGYHRGEINDDYVCSSKSMLEQYQNRPEDFTREIIASGTTDDCRTLEKCILDTVDAKRNVDFYNKSNGFGRNMFDRSGIKHKEITKKKIRNAHIGKRLSEETRRKMSLAHKGRKNTAEHIKATAKGCQKECIVMGKRYESGKQAALNLGVSRSTISNWIKSNNTKYSNCFFI